ncbi:MAG: 1-deoxy-D-xylulose-5-phosphate synthase [Ruminococcaceae bacterium]|nr:1-deoxy-D-xylulose-5-phosphate synthase [Oscillospiraceae bacterium]
MVSLEEIRSPEDVRKLHKDELPLLCDQLRQKMIDTVSVTGGHLASNLGTVELTVALHRVFRLPTDTVVWDVGHQCYAHKLLTGRYDRFDTLRRKDGISGFPKPEESEYDSFITGHSSTAISAANGIAKAKALSGDDSYTVAVIGDGAMTGGLAYEGLSNAGRSEDRLLVILNDNKMSISQNVGFVSRYLSGLRTKVRYVRWKQKVATTLRSIPLIGHPISNLLEWFKKKMRRSLFTDTSYFEKMGYRYLGPVDGHDLDDLVQAMLSAKSIGKPVLLHVTTVKGKGYPEAEKNPDIFHGIGVFDPATGAAQVGGDSFSAHFGDTLCQLAREDDRIVAVTAAMKKGTCLDAFSKEFPTRFFDAGIAEGHAVTFSSGMACGGLLPVFAVYSTFLQRSFDQLLNDTSIMNNHVVLAIDRAGVVPDDGETHQGLYDVAMLRAIPHTWVYAPSTFKELELNLRQALYDTDGIAAVRYPKGGESPALADYEPSYKHYDYMDSKRRNLLLVTYGRTFGEVQAYVRKRQRNGEHLSVLKLNRIHPLPEDVVDIAGQYATVLFFEEAARQGGVGEHLGACLMLHGYTGRYAVRAIDHTLGACTTAQGLEATGLDVAGVAAFVEEYTGE